MTDLQVLYEIQRTEIIIGFCNAPDDGNCIEAALAFAYERRIYPFFHETHFPNESQDLFDGCYSIEKSFIEEVINHVHNIWVKDESKLPTFYDLENTFSGRVGDTRGALINIFRYCYISSRFDEQVYEKLKSYCPAEAHGLTRDFDKIDLYL
jgi:hypothetical protein